MQDTTLVVRFTEAGNYVYGNDLEDLLDMSPAEITKTMRNMQYQGKAGDMEIRSEETGKWLSVHDSLVESTEHMKHGDAKVIEMKNLRFPLH